VSGARRQAHVTLELDLAIEEEGLPEELTLKSLRRIAKSIYATIGDQDLREWVEVVHCEVAEAMALHPRRE
jgi:hypothetical protein